MNADKCLVLKGRNVTLFPDLNCYDKWNSIAPKLSFKISDLLESNATDAEKLEGLDMADYLLKFSVGEFALVEKTKNERPMQYEKLTLSHFGTPVSAFKPPVPIFKIVTWDKEIAALEQYFETAEVPVQAIKLNQCTVTDVPRFVKAHLENAKRNNGNERFLPYLRRLREVRDVLSRDSFVTP